LESFNEYDNDQQVESARILAAQNKIIAVLDIHDRTSILNANGNTANFLAVSWPGSHCGPDMRLNSAFSCPVVQPLREDALREIHLLDQDYFIHADDLGVGMRFNLGVVTHLDGSRNLSI
jgi:hypothetical protein